MAIEEIKHNYYESSTTSKNYVDSRLSSKIAVFNYLVRAFFGKDTSRLVYAEPDFAFRARLNALAKGVQEGDLFLNNLQLPFGSFWITDPPEIIKSASCSELLGIYSRELEYYMHFFEVKQKFNAIIWFDREDDCNAAYTMALAESHSQAPYIYVDKIYWRSKGLAMPHEVCIKKVNLGKQSTTFDKFLSENRMFALVLDIEVEVPQLHINRGKNLIQLPVKWSYAKYADNWKDEDKEYYCQKCIIDFSQDVWNAYPSPPKVQEAPILENVSLLTREQLHELDNETTNAVASILPNRNVCEMVEAAFKNNSNIRLNLLSYNKGKTTIDDKGEVTAVINCKVHRSTYQYWKQVSVVVPARPDPIILTDCHLTEFSIPGLHPNSTYTIHLLAEDTAGNVTDYELEFTTPVWEKETLAVMDGTEESINNRVNTDPTVVPHNSLIELDDDWSGLEL